LPGYTSRTITRKAPLIQELAEVRERGYAVAVDELEQGLTAVAAPIRNAPGDIIASMSVSGASFRLNGEALETAVKELVAAAAEVSFRLGWNDPVG
jgi:DNA-binding IclR family transcriptional regulator